MINSEEERKKEEAIDVFQLPLVRIPSIIDEILDAKSPREMTKMETYIFHNDSRESLETVEISEMRPYTPNDN